MRKPYDFGSPCDCCEGFVDFRYKVTASYRVYCSQECFDKAEKKDEKTYEQERDQVIIDEAGRIGREGAAEAFQFGRFMADWCKSRFEKMIAEKQKTIEEQKKYVAETNDRILSSTAMIESLRSKLITILNTSKDPIKCLGMGSSEWSRYGFVLTEAEKAINELAEWEKKNGQNT